MLRLYMRALKNDRATRLAIGKHNARAKFFEFEKKSVLHEFCKPGVFIIVHCITT